MCVSTKAPWKPVVDGPSGWTAASRTGDLGGFLGLTLLPGLTLAVVSSWEVNQVVEDLFLSVVLSLKTDKG